MILFCFVVFLLVVFSLFIPLPLSLFHLDLLGSSPSVLCGFSG